MSEPGVVVGLVAVELRVSYAVTEKSKRRPNTLWLFESPPGFDIFEIQVTSRFSRWFALICGVMLGWTPCRKAPVICEIAFRRLRGH